MRRRPRHRCRFPGVHRRNRRRCCLRLIILHRSPWGLPRHGSAIFSCLFPRPIPASNAPSSIEATTTRPPSRRPSSQPEALDRDLLVSAQTGSGKTVAYGLAMASHLLGDAERFDAPREPLALDHRPDPRAGPPGQPRADLALWPGRRAAIASCVGGMDPRREQRALGRRLPTSWSARRGACATIWSAARLDTSKMRRRRARRGRRDARPRLPRGPGIHPRRHAGGAPHPAVLRDHAEAHRRPGEALSARCACASTRWSRTSAATATSSIARIGDRPRTKSSMPSSTCCASTRAAAPWCSATPARRCGICMPACIERGFSAVALSGEQTQNERSRRPAGAARRARPGLRRHRRRRAAASTCPTSASSSMSTCRTIPRRSSTAAAAPAAPARKGVCVHARALYAPPQGREARRTWRGSTRPGPARLRRRNPPARPGSPDAGPDLHRGDDGGGSRHGARAPAPNARQRRSPMPWRVSTVRGCPLPRRSWILARSRAASAQGQARAAGRAHSRRQLQGPGFVRGRVRACSSEDMVWFRMSVGRPQQCRSPLAFADHLPPRPRDEEGDRIDQDLRP